MKWNEINNEINEYNEESHRNKHLALVPSD